MPCRGLVLRWIVENHRDLNQQSHMVQGQVSWHSSKPRKVPHEALTTSYHSNISGKFQCWLHENT